jgi:hypothetical protein
MKHYKEGENHIFEFGEMSITRIKLKQSQYKELADYFAQQQVKNLNIPAVSWRSEHLKTFLSKLVEEFDNGEVSWNTRDDAENMLKSF